MSHDEHRAEEGPYLVLFVEGHEISILKPSRRDEEIYELFRWVLPDEAPNVFGYDRQLVRKYRAKV